MNLLLILVACLIPFAWYFWHDHKINTPSLQWPAMKSVLGLHYESSPPRLSGAWNGRKIAVEALEDSVSVTVWLGGETRLRVECGPKDLVTSRAGMLVPDAVDPVVIAFREKLLARCSDKTAGPVVFDAIMQQRLVDLKAVDFVGEQFRVVWKVPVVRDINETEALFGALCAIADGLEIFPTSGATPNAQAKRS